MPLSILFSKINVCAEALYAEEAAQQNSAKMR